MKFPAGRFADQSECNDPVAFLCGEQSDFMTGHNIINDGGVYQGVFLGPRGLRVMTSDVEMHDVTGHVTMTACASRGVVVAIATRLHDDGDRVSLGMRDVPATSKAFAGAAADRVVRRGRLRDGRALD